MTPTQQKAVKRALALLESAHVATDLVWERSDCCEALRAALAERKPLFKPLIDQHPGLAEELAEQADDKADAERFVLFTSGKVDIMPAMVTAICTKVDTNTQWWREAIDAARNKP